MTTPAHSANAIGYGNIYTPHAGSMVIHVQREAALANRTIVLGPNTVRLLRLANSRVGRLLGVLLVVAIGALAVQAARVPLLTHRLAVMERDARRIDSLQTTVTALRLRYDRLSTMVGGASAAPVAAPAPAAAAVAAPPATPAAAR
jgi:hypothetical protein